MLKNQKGFTLIELAIVLVIIGIILGAVLKGQDLIQNARAKQFISKVKAWEVAQWTYYDRKGKFAGTTGSGLIGKNTNDDVKTDLLNAKFINPPYEGTSGSESNTITLGSYVFYVYFGNDGTKNIMTICSNSTCAAFGDDNIVSYAEALDTSIDGTTDGTAGQVIGTTTTPTYSSAKWVATFSTAPTASAWTSSTVSIVYYFDAKR
ncbi:prepilin-type N-terminal cleavage/methylation domain-containing protein [Thermodesulfovibrio yellowstonii]|uniref:prepilin-type N-terminal cleavage/methylation domain-containing protein n=1 Tax=Thermodesulfovibrio yellowstonii TaxID=28262 RepID=UPI0024B36154|nr:prepilin-type N-terminal cleavage/methylation domain-containing protein [Thermodesulfovibrio yellowstonii]MDI6864586.1 prepilin-type N-terminal cleavage/methylation domain-containing protein [Thermodesulfovibrio yellowstonii]